MSNFWFVYTLLEWAIRLLMVLVILRRRLPPTLALAWLSIIFFQPELGLFFYLLLGGGTHHLARRRVRRHRSLIAVTRAEKRLAGQTPHIDPPPAIPAAHLPLIKQARSIGGFNILRGNQVEFLADSDEVVSRLIADIDQARQHVHLLYYIFSNDETGKRVCDALVRAAQRGVTCRVLADAAGSWGFFKRNGLASCLRSAGIQTMSMLPAAILRRRLARLDMRNHRKLAIIDGVIAYAGSHNIVNADYGRQRGNRWIDLTGRFTGPLVMQLQIVFLEDWAFETGKDLYSPELVPLQAPAGNTWAQTVPTGPNHEAEALPRVLLTAINSAEKQIIITTPYLVPDEPTLLALAMAADRGVKTTLVLPTRSDHPLVCAAGRFYYEELLENGVEILLHQQGLLHSKTMTVDDSFALLGSSNLDIRSFYLNFELNVLMYGPDITRQLRAMQKRYFEHCIPVNLNAWRRRPLISRYTQGAAALLSPLL